MSQDDLEKVAELLLKPHQKTENKKMWIWVLGFTGTILMIGAVGGNWVFWRSNTDEWRQEFSKTVKEDHTYIQGEQAIKNERAMRKINAIQPKTGE